MPQITFHEMIAIEVDRDVQTAGEANLIPVLQAWVQHTKEQPKVQTEVMSRGVLLVWPQISGRRKHQLAEEILASETLSVSLNEAAAKELLSSYLGGFTLGVLQPPSQRLVQRFLRHPGLTDNQQAMMEGALAMTTRAFPDHAPPRIRRWLSALDRARYREEAQKLITRFFTPDTTVDSHVDMLQAAYVQAYHADFWELYWEHFRAMLIDPKRVQQIVELLSFWFDESLGVLSEQPYLSAAFFLELPAILEEAGESRNFGEQASLIGGRARRLPWYPLLRPYLLAATKRRPFRILKR